MRRLFKIALPALATAATLAVAVPAQAYYDDGGRDRYHSSYQDRAQGNWGQSQAIRQRINELQRMVERNDRRDNLSNREAAGLRRDVWQLRDMYQAMNRNGLSTYEARQLTHRINQIRDRLHHERFDRDGRRL